MRKRIKKVMYRVFSIPIDEIPDDASVHSLLTLLSLEAIASYLQDQEKSYNDAKSRL